MFLDNTIINYNTNYFNSYLKENNLIVTQVRNEVLNVIHSLEQPFTKKDILEEVEEKGISKQTAWNTIPLLLKSGIMKRIIIDTNEIKIVEKFELVNIE